MKNESQSSTCHKLYKRVVTYRDSIQVMPSYFLGEIDRIEGGSREGQPPMEMQH